MIRIKLLKDSIKENCLLTISEQTHALTCPKTSNWNAKSLKWQEKKQ